MRTIEWPPLCSANHEFKSVDGIVPEFFCNGVLRVRAGFGVVENLAVEVLFGALFINRCIQAILFLEREVFPRHSRPVPIISTQKKVRTITAGAGEVDGHTIADRTVPNR